MSLSQPKVRTKAAMEWAVEQGIACLSSDPSRHQLKQRLTCTGAWSNNGSAEFLVPDDFNLQGEQFTWTFFNKHRKGTGLTTYTEFILVGVKSGLIYRASGPNIERHIQAGFRALCARFTCQQSPNP